MTRKYNRGPSEAQSNAEALARRDRTYSQAHQLSVTVSQDYRRRQPETLRDAVRAVRRAYEDEVPAKLHSGTELADDGTPAMTPRATSYIFGNAQQTDAGNEEVRPLISYYIAPFRATLDNMERGDPQNQRRARIVKHVTIGSQGPQEAAIAEQAHPFDAKLVALDALTSFLKRLSDVKVDARQEPAAA